jgi:hypothetical protein
MTLELFCNIRSLSGEVESNYDKLNVTRKHYKKKSKNAKGGLISKKKIVLTSEIL